jgi:hypothetical protein
VLTPAASTATRLFLHGTTPPPPLFKKKQEASQYTLHLHSLLLLVQINVDLNWWAYLISLES